MTSQILTTSQILDNLDTDQIFSQELLKESEQAYQDYLKDSKDYKESE